MLWLICIGILELRESRSKRTKVNEQTYILANTGYKQRVVVVDFICMGFELRILQNAKLEILVHSWICNLKSNVDIQCAYYQGRRDRY